MKNALYIITMAIGIISSSYFAHSKMSDDTVITKTARTMKDSTNMILSTPIYQKGTFWKIKNEQTTINNITGKTSVYTTNHSCYINNVTEYKGVKVYEMYYLKNNEAVITGYINKSNLGMNDFVKYRKNYDDTLTVQIELLDFPLFKGKTWESICKKQEHFAKSKITTFKIKHNVIGVFDTTFIADEETVRTKSYRIKATYTIDNKAFSSEYNYLVPSNSFPGSCPLFLYWQFKNNAVILPQNKNVKHEYSSTHKQFITNYNW